MSAMRVESLRCEFQDTPLAVETATPRLSWIPVSDVSGDTQTKYQVQVATSPEQLEKSPDLWDSGPVGSSQTLNVIYQGAEVKPEQQAFWRVRVWDREGSPSDWSAVASWTAAIGRWSAKWIEAPDSESLAPEFQGCNWIWAGGHKAAEKAPAGSVVFSKSIELPEGAIRRAVLHIAADNIFEVALNGQVLGDGDNWWYGYAVDLRPGLRTGSNAVSILVTNPVPSPAGVVGKLTIEQEGRSPLQIPLDANWTAQENPGEGWKGGAQGESKADVIAPFGAGPWNSPRAFRRHRAMPLFRREFRIAKPLKRAIVQVCGLGQYELMLNGRKVGDDILNPGWTDYWKRSLYITHDITSEIWSGSNALGVALGNGMYNNGPARYTKFIGDYRAPKLILQMRLDYEDGTTETVVSDETWRVAEGPITTSHIYGGEDYDARRELVGWSEADYTDSGWVQVVESEAPGEGLVPQTQPPLKVHRIYSEQKRTVLGPGTVLIDLGQNHSGRPRIRVKGKAGARVRIWPSELLNESGRVDQQSHGGPVYFTYTLSGRGEETWSPQFHMHGFRYLQVEGVSTGQDELPELLHAANEAFYSDAEEVGQFECSNKLFNDVHRLILMSIRSNLHSVLTDCPHREKLGWLEVTHLLGPSVMFNYDVSRLWEKQCDDMRDGQLPDGLVPDYVPEYTIFGGGFRDSPEWGSASLIDPWLLYKRYGDEQVLRDNYEMMQRYVAYLGSKADGHIVSHGLGDWYDVGPGHPGPSQLTSKGVTATATYFYDLTILSRIAYLLGKHQDGRRYADLAAEVRQAFNKTFYKSGVGYDTGSQTANAMPVVVGLADEEQTKVAIEALVADFAKRNYHVTAGDVGFHYVVQALTDASRSDVLAKFAAHAEPPSYGYQLTQGATSLTEAWNADKDSSHNHCMLGHLEQWFYEGLAGIAPHPDAVAWDRIVINPRIVEGVTWAKAHHDTVRGRVASSWKLDGGVVVLEVQIPVGSVATVHVPGSGQVVEVGSGKHRFRAPISR